MATPTSARSSLAKKYNFGSSAAEDRYGIPENFLEIEVGGRALPSLLTNQLSQKVRDPQIKGEKGNKYVDYEIVCRVNDKAVEFKVELLVLTLPF